MLEQPTPRIENVQYAVLEDGRDIAIQQHGNGYHTIFDFHGSPGSRLNPVPRNSELTKLNVRMITFDRPGYGRSTEKPGRRVADTADDVRQVADALGARHFGLIARSGGVPHALGCAALMPDRVGAIVGLAGLAPPNLLESWDKGMSSYNQTRHAAAVLDPETLAQDFNNSSEEAKKNRKAILEVIWPDLPRSDRDILAPMGPIATMVTEAHQEGLRSSGRGWIDDTLALNNPKGWGFDIGKVICPTVLIYGKQDPFVGAQHTELLRQSMPNASSVVLQDDGHFGGMRLVRHSLAFLRGMMEDHHAYKGARIPSPERLQQDFGLLPKPPPDDWAAGNFFFS